MIYFKHFRGGLLERGGLIERGDLIERERGLINLTEYCRCDSISLIHLSSPLMRRTRILSFNYSQYHAIPNKYNIQWQTKTIKSTKLLLDLSLKLHEILLHRAKYHLTFLFYKAPPPGGLSVSVGGGGLLGKGGLNRENTVSICWWKIICYI